MYTRDQHTICWRSTRLESWAVMRRSYLKVRLIPIASVVVERCLCAMLIDRLGTERRLPPGRDGRFGRFQPKQVFGLVKAALVAGLASNVDQGVLLVASAQPASLEGECSVVQVGHIRGEFRASQFLRGLQLTNSPLHALSGGSCPCSGDRSPCSSSPFHFCSSPTGKPVIS